MPVSRPGFESAHNSELPKRLTGVRVLLVDDELDTLEMLDAVLTAEDAEVRVVNSAADAWKILLDWKPDVLVSEPHRF